MSSLLALGALPVDRQLEPTFAPDQLASLAQRPRVPLWVVSDAGGALGIVPATKEVTLSPVERGGWPVIAGLAPLYPEWLGDRAFNEAHRVRFPYVVGAMANGITSAEMVIAAAKAQLLAFFGAGGLDYGRVTEGVDTIRAALGPERSFGSNLIHSPNEPALEKAVAELYLERGVRFVSASAYMKLTAPVVRVSAAGLNVGTDGQIERQTHLFAKVSRPEVAEQFMSPAPVAILRQLVQAGQISEQQARLAERVPVAEDITAEADSGGHTDNRPLTVLLPTFRQLRDDLQARFDYPTTIRIGAGGGIGDPAAVAAAFAMGAAYVVTGSVNQATVEAGTSPRSRELLAAADIADVMMAPSPDMFELGVKVQVLKRGTLFAQRAAKLYDAYRQHDSLEQLPSDLRKSLEKEIFQAPLDEIWRDTQRFFADRNPRELDRAARDPHHKMALVFRWYVGKSSRWAIAGEKQRELDYQIWCGPAMGAFNRWARGSFLQDHRRRTVVQLALNLLEGAAVITRAQQLRSAGLVVAPSAFDFRPRPLGLSG